MSNKKQVKKAARKSRETGRPAGVQRLAALSPPAKILEPKSPTGRPAPRSSAKVVNPTQGSSAEKSTARKDSAPVSSGSKKSSAPKAPAPKRARVPPTIDEALAQRKSRDIAGVLESLSSILAPFGRVLEAEMHPELGYGLKLPADSRGKQPFFGGVRIGKDHVVFSLPVLARFPQLLRLISPGLRKSSRKKTSFVFRRDEPALFSELSTLTRACYEHLREEERV